MTTKGHNQGNSQGKNRVTIRQLPTGVPGHDCPRSSRPVERCDWNNACGFVDLARLSSKRIGTPRRWRLIGRIAGWRDDTILADVVDGDVLSLWLMAEGR